MSQIPYSPHLDIGLKGKRVPSQKKFRLGKEKPWCVCPLCGTAHKQTEKTELVNE